MGKVLAGDGDALHVIRRAGHLHPSGVQRGTAPAGTAASSGRGKTFEGALDDELAQDLVERAEHVELQVRPEGREVSMPR